MIEYVIGLHNAPNDAAWWSAHLRAWTPNLFAATRYEQNPAVELVQAMKGQGVEAYTEMLQVAAGRYAFLMDEKIRTDEKELRAVSEGENKSVHARLPFGRCLLRLAQQLLFKGKRRI